MSNIKQIIVWRNDLKVRKGKFGAQCAHSAMKNFVDNTVRERAGGYILKNKMGVVYYPHVVYLTEEQEEWCFNEKFTKIVVRCNSLEELLELERQAKEAGIPCAVIEDNGNTEFKETCQNCGGSGWLVYDHAEDQKCPMCNGTGKVNKPTITCLAIGPDTALRIDPITWHLELMQE